MSARDKMLKQADIDEIVRFQDYLDDLNGDILPEEFAKKWADYMGVIPRIAEAHVKLHRVGK